MKPYRHSLRQSARQLRSNMTDAEQTLWQRIRRKQIRSVQFYRQKPLLNYIVDFYCPKARLVIELDGSQHFEPVHQKRDAERHREKMEIRYSDYLQKAYFFTAFTGMLMIACLFVYIGIVEYIAPWFAVVFIFVIFATIALKMFGAGMESLGSP